MIWYTCLIVALTLPALSNQEGLEYFSKETKCLVCRVTVHEINKTLRKIDPTRTINIPGYGLEKETRKVPYIRSEMYLTELMEGVCGKIDGYVKAWYKDTEELTLIKLMGENDSTMNELVGNVEFVQDGDLNKSLPHFCMEILEDNEHAFLEYYMKGEDAWPAENRICYEKAKYCNEELTGVYGETVATMKLDLN